MNSIGRGLVFVAKVLVIGAVISLLSHRRPLPAAEVPAEAAGAGLSEAVRVAAQPSTPSGSDGTNTLARLRELTPAAAVSNSTDDSLAAQVHVLEDANPKLALELAQKAQTLSSSGPRAAEFAATEVKCLYRLGKLSEGRAAAEAMVNKYPNSPWALEVEKQTGAHPNVQH